MGFMWDLPNRKWEVHGILSHLEDVCLWFQVAFNGLLIGFDQDHYGNMEKLCENNGIIMNHDCWIVCQGSLEVKQYIICFSQSYTWYDRTWRPHMFG